MSGLREVILDNYIQIILLAAVADGEIKEDELQVIHKLKTHHPRFKSVSDDQANQIVASVYNKISAGMEIKHILEQMASNMNENEKNVAYALAKEMCVSDFHYPSSEVNFIKLIEEIWSISDEVIEKVGYSIQLRYFN